MALKSCRSKLPIYYVYNIIYDLTDKFSRVFLLVLTALFNWYGFVAGIVLLIVLIATTKTVTGVSYLYPLIPFNKEAMKSLFVRRNIQNSTKQSEE